MEWGDSMRDVYNVPWVPITEDNVDALLDEREALTTRGLESIEIEIREPPIPSWTQAAGPRIGGAEWSHTEILTGTSA